ncbi:2-aminoethylphosphonate--pyruvate transaminase-like [Clavelina lepadiformis]|uniref:2-aminoethylphosphonate--pyruvate transaminase-like n=1 Tax=Clavelina lepadiformis TaxID=159417 RepID=UPI0040436ACD
MSLQTIKMAFLANFSKVKVSRIIAPASHRGKSVQQLKAKQKPIRAYSSDVKVLEVKNCAKTTNTEIKCGIDRKLFTPGPVMVSDRVKRAMLHDVGTRHADFTYVIKFIRQALLQVANVTSDSHTAVLLNGSGTMATEAMLQTVIPRKDKKMLVMVNGIYGQRIGQLCNKLNINCDVISHDLTLLEQRLSSADDIIGVMAVQCETSSGMINPVEEIGSVVKGISPDCLYFVDAVTSFGAIPVRMTNIDFLISCANKSLQSVPGISFVVADKETLQKHRGKGSGMVLDVADQCDELDRTGQFRFTPPTHAMLAFKEALLEHIKEGRVEGRAKRFRDNASTLKSEMTKMGFRQLIDDEKNPNGYFVTSFVHPINPLFVFEEFYQRLSDRGHVICPDRSNLPNSFRIGCMGDLYPRDMQNLVDCIEVVCSDMGINLPMDNRPL